MRVEQISRSISKYSFILRNVPSLGVSGKNTPAFCCPAGIERMARVYKEFPQQYDINLKALLEEDNEFLAGAALLQEAYNKLS